MNGSIDFLFQGTVLENLSLQCGKFLKKLNIENCKFITDQNMRFKQKIILDLNEINIDF